MSRPADHRAHRLELVATLVLALSTLLTAWAGFQVARWRTIDSDRTTEASATRTESARASTQAGQENVADVVMFTQWLNAVAEDPTALVGALGEDGDAGHLAYRPDPGSLTSFYHQRMRDELRVALDAWLATDPLGDPEAPATPFDVPEYQLATMARAEELTAEAERLAAEGDVAGRQADDYVLLTVLFASALFFAGVSTKLRARPASVTMLSLSCAVVTGAGVLLLVMPKQL